jgi:hypothetical protein
MKNLLSTPSYRSGAVRLADTLEIFALRAPRFRASQSDLIASLDQKEDEDEDGFERPTLDALAEIGLRQKHLGRFSNSYPFTTQRTSLALKPGKIPDSGLLYLFLLFATALDMRSDRNHAGLDAALLFEHFSCEVGKNFWGGRSATHDDSLVKSLVFGTSRSRFDQSSAATPRGFKNAVDDLCSQLGEGGCYRPKSSDRVYAQDDRLDVVVWRQFSDGRAGRLIAFGQCKTGTHWQKELPRLQPTSFCNKWLRENPVVPPIVLFFLTDRVSGSLVNESYDSGLLFDRCRVLDYADPLPKALIADCVKWTRAVMLKYALG